MHSQAIGDDRGASNDMPSGKRDEQSRLRYRVSRLALALALAAMSFVLASPQRAFAADPIVQTSTDLSYFGGASENDAATWHPDWMSWLKPDLSLGALTLPGTHDSGTYALDIGGFPAPRRSYVDQTMSLAAQLQAGIRFFDIRVACTYDREGNYDFPVFHGDNAATGLIVQPQVLDLYDVAESFSKFFGAHPTESAIVEISHSGYNGDVCKPLSTLERTFRDNDRRDVNENGSYAELFSQQYALIQHDFGGLFYQDPTKKPCDDLTKAPTVAQARRHIVMEMGFNPAATTNCKFNALQDPGNSWFDDPREWADANACTGTDMKKFDDFVVAHMYAIAHGQGTAAVSGAWTQASNPILYVDPSGGTCVGYSYKSALRVNTKLLALLIGGYFGRGVNLGFVAMDYPGGALISALVLMNMQNAVSKTAAARTNDFQQGAQDLFHAYSQNVGVADAPGRALAQQRFFQAAQPDAVWHSVVTWASPGVQDTVWWTTNGAGSWGTVAPYEYFVWQTASGATPDEVDFQGDAVAFHEKISEILAGQSFSDPLITKNLYMNLQAAYPKAACTVVLQRYVPGSAKVSLPWSVQTWGVFYAVPTYTNSNGDFHFYVMCTAKPSGLTAGRGAPIPVSGSGPTTLPSTPSSSSPASSPARTFEASGSVLESSVPPLAATNASDDARGPLLIATGLIVVGALALGLGGRATGDRHH